MIPELEAAARRVAAGYLVQVADRIAGDHDLIKEGARNAKANGDLKSNIDERLMLAEAFCYAEEYVRQIVEDITGRLTWAPERAMKARSEALLGGSDV